MRRKVVAMDVARRSGIDFGVVESDDAQREAPTRFAKGGSSSTIIDRRPVEGRTGVVGSLPDAGGRAEEDVTVSTIAGTVQESAPRRVS